MPEINITVDNKIAIKADETEYICSNSDFVVNFNFDSEWEAYETKTARFSHNGGYIDVVFSGSQCAVPIIKDTYCFFVGVYAGNLHTTTPARVPCKLSILCGSSAPAAPTDDVYNQIMERLNELGTTDPEAIAAAVAEYIAQNPIAETDPTVPEWAKAAKKPSYTADEVGAVAKTELQTAVDTALAQAKASGAFDGADGHTPEKGVDYWTEADKTEVVAEAAAAIDLTSYAKKNEVPTKTSQLTNDSGFLTSHQDISGKQDKSTLEADVAAKGFTKNTGTYSKPAGGIPKADLAAAVQTSLGKADTALQEHQSLAAYRTAVAQNIIDAGKQDKLIAGENITIASDGKTISATGGGAETLFVTITDSNGTLSADKSYNDIFNAIIAGIPVLVSYSGMILPLIGIADALYFGLFQCANADASNGAIVATVMIEITENNEVNDISAQIDIPSAVTDDHINSLIDTKLGVIENGSY